MRKRVNSLLPAGAGTQGSTPEDAKGAAAPARESASAFKSPIKHFTDIGSAKQQEIAYLHLPVSNKERKVLIRDLDPDDCFASRFNKRSQAFLTLDNPKFKAIYSDLKETKVQREPGLVRVVPSADGSPKYEIIYGLRRHGGCSLINKEMAEEGGFFPFRAKVVDDLSDADAKMLSDQENSQREDVSPWELASFLKRETLSGGIYAGKTHQYIAESEGIDKSSVTRLLQLSELDEKWIALFVSPDNVAERPGAALAKLLSDKPAAQLNDVYEAAKVKAPFDKTSPLVSLIKAHFPSESRVTSQRGGAAVESKSGASIVIKEKRNKPGEFKIDLTNAPKELIEKLAIFLENN